jgi:hypothetical protein
VAIEEIKVLLQQFLSVNPIFVVICGPKQPLQNCLSKASFMLFMFLNQPSWLPLISSSPAKTRAVFAHAQSIFPPVPLIINTPFQKVSQFGERASFSCVRHKLSPTSQSRKRGSIAKDTCFPEACNIVL